MSRESVLNIYPGLPFGPSGPGLGQGRYLSGGDDRSMATCGKNLHRAFALATEPEPCAV